MHLFLDVTVLVQDCCQAKTHSGYAIGGVKLHVREVARDGGMLAVRIQQFGELKLRLYPQVQGAGVACSQSCWRDVKIRTAHPSQRRVESEEPRQRLEHNGLAGTIRSEQEGHRLEINGGWHGPERLKVADPQPSKFHPGSLLCLLEIALRCAFLGRVLTGIRSLQINAADCWIKTLQQLIGGHALNPRP